MGLCGGLWSEPIKPIKGAFEGFIGSIGSEPIGIKKRNTPIPPRTTPLEQRVLTSASVDGQCSNQRASTGNLFYESDLQGVLIFSLVLLNILLNSECNSFALVAELSSIGYDLVPFP